MKHKNIFFLPIKISLQHAALALCIALLVIGTAQKIFAQDAAKDNVVAAVKTNNESSSETEREQYLIGSGDVLDIRIFNRPLLSRDSVRVDGMNMIRLPLIGEVRAGCQTESGLAREITRHYLEYLKNPNVEVFIKDYQSKPVMVMGAVRAPGQFQMRRRVRLLELLSLAGGLTDEADGRIQVKHASDARTCGAADMENKTAAATIIMPAVEWYAVGELLRDGERTEKIPYVEPGDTINLLEAGKVYVVGNVVKPSTISLKEKTTITKAVAAAGGALPDSKLEKVRILRQINENDRTKTEIIVDLRAINKRQAEDIALQANDIVDVPTSNGKKFLRGLINGIVPTVSRATVRVIP